MLKIFALFGGLTFVSFGIVTGQALLVQFARSIDLKTSSALGIITKAITTPSLYAATAIYFLAIMSYLYISKQISFTSLNLSLTGIIILLTVAADYFFFKQHLNWAHFAGAAFMLMGLGFMLLATKQSGTF